MSTTADTAVSPFALRQEEGEAVRFLGMLAAAAEYGMEILGPPGISS